MKALYITFVLCSSSLSFGFSGLISAETIEKYEITALTKAKSTFELNHAKMKILNLKRHHSICDAELSQKIVPLNCYLLNEAALDANLISNNDFQSANNTFDNQCLSSTAEITDQEGLPSTYPKSMSKECSQTIIAQKNKLKYILMGKKGTN